MPLPCGPAPAPAGSCPCPLEHGHEGGAASVAGEAAGGTVPPPQSVQGPFPSVPVCFPDQPPLGSFSRTRALANAAPSAWTIFPQSSGLSGSLPSRSRSLGKSCHVLLQPHASHYCRALIPVPGTITVGAQCRCLLGDMAVTAPSVPPEWDRRFTSQISK